MIERGPKDFIEDMQAHGRSWLDIIAVARVVRNGKWYDDVKCLLQRDGEMPLDEAVILKMRKADIAKGHEDEKPKYTTGRPKAHRVGPVKRIRSGSSDQKD